MQALAGLSLTGKRPFRFGGNAQSFYSEFVTAAVGLVCGRGPDGKAFLFVRQAAVILVRRCGGEGSGWGNGRPLAKFFCCANGNGRFGQSLLRQGFWRVKRPSFGTVFLFGVRQWSVWSELVAAEVLVGETAVLRQSFFAVQEVLVVRQYIAK